MKSTIPAWKKMRTQALERGDCARCAKRPAVRGNYCDECRVETKRRRAEWEARQAAKVPLPGIFQHFRASVTTDTRKILRAITDAALIESAGKMFLRWWLPSVKNGCPVAQHEINRVILESLEAAKTNADDPYYQKQEFKAAAIRCYPQYHGIDGVL